MTRAEEELEELGRQLVVLLVAALGHLEDRAVRHVPDERAQPILLGLDAALALALQPPRGGGARAEQQQLVGQQVVRERSVQELVAAHRGSMSDMGRPR